MNVLEDKKGENILLLDIREQAVFADYFVICSGTSDRMLKALHDAVAEEIFAQFKVKSRLEGKSGDGWVLADFGDVIVHFFSPQKRTFYHLEELWSAAKVLVRLQ